MSTTLTKAPANRVREYETIYILRSDVDPDTAEKLSGRLNDVMTREAGRLVKVENWGRRRLAYDIAKHKRGVYTYVKYLGGGKLVRMAVNQEIVPASSAVRGGDEVAFFPPVTGG